MKRIIICILCVFSIFKANARYDIKTFTLANGLRVILSEKKTSPIVSFSLWYDCGSVCDAISKSGVAHYLEHMAFCSNKGVFNEFLENIGADRNAFTSLRTICFYEIVPSEKIETVFEHEAKRMESIDIDKEKFLSEKGAILEERSMVCDSNPGGQLSESLFANLFNRTMGGISIIGWKNEIESIEEQDLIDFHNKWFAPNNATLIMVGDIDINKIKPLIEKYFGHIKSKELHCNSKTSEKPTCVKEIEFKSPKMGAISNVEYIYFVPDSIGHNFRKSMTLKLAIKMLNQPDFFAKKMLEHYSNKAFNLSFEYINGYFQYSIATVSISCSSSNNRNDAEKIWKYLANKLEHVNVSQEILDRVKRQEAIATAYKKDDIKQISEYLGWMLSFGHSLEEIQSADETIQSITLNECIDIIKEVFCTKPISILRIIPKGYDRE